jgi:hypothetical protein
MRTVAQKQNRPQKAVPSSFALPNTAALKTHHTASPHFGHDFSRISIHSPAAGSIQTKLAINKPGDEHEQEADRVAEQVMRMPEPQFPRAYAHDRASPGCQTDVSQPIANAIERQTGETARTIYRKEDKSSRDKCRTVATQRWGCDTACSRAGFMDDETPFTDATGERGKTPCCNKWPPFVESYAINHLSLDGVASCKGGMYRKIFRVGFKDKEVRIGCTDSTTRDADHELELSPLAARKLFERDDFPLNTKVKACPDGALSNLCEPDPEALNNPKNPAFPRQTDCVEKGCIPQDPFVDCSRYDWPRV